MDKNSLSKTDYVRGVHRLINKGIIKGSIGKMRSVKLAGPLRLLSEVVKPAREARIDMITDLINYKKEGIIPAEWELSTIVHCYKGKRDASQRGNYRGLKLTDQFLKIVERLIRKLIRQQVDINEMQFGFVPRCGAADVIFILQQLQEKYLAKKKNLHFAYVDLEKAFDRVSRDTNR